MLRQVVVTAALALAAFGPALGDEVMEPSLRDENRVLSVPYGFYNDNFGFAVAYAYAINGYPQPQAGLLATVMAGTEGSAMGMLMGQNIRFSGMERLFVDPVVSIGYYSGVDAYTDGNPNFPDERAGSNDSNPHDFITGSGWDNYFRLRFRYLLPIGSGRDQVLPAYRFSEGLLVGGASGGRAFNPLSSGRTYVEVMPFYRSMNIRNDDLDSALNTNGLDFSLFWDNRNYPANPSSGSGLSLKVTRDFGWANSSGSWTALNAEFDHYVQLGDSKWMRQRVLAFDVSTSFSPTWDEQPDGTVRHGPPPFAGATLGGLWRMRGYPSQRFSDKAFICYAAELRLVPRWNPFDALPRLQERLGVGWIQVVPFGEVGRVAPHWNLQELHRDMRWDVGLGIRAWAKGLVVRADFAYSDEGYYLQMMVSQPFQF